MEFAEPSNQSVHLWSQRITKLLIIQRGKEQYPVVSFLFNTVMNSIRVPVSVLEETGVAVYLLVEIALVLSP